jgi:hypothetical protein
MAYDLFISYSREDEDMMKRISDDLRAEGLVCWTDEGIKPGSPSWKIDIENAIRASDALVVLLSPTAAQSRWVRAEIDFAEALDKPMYPVLLSGDETNAVPFGFTTYQWVDMRQQNAYDSGIELLLKAVRRYAGSDRVVLVADKNPTAKTTTPDAASPTPVSSRQFSPLLVGGAVVAVIAVLLAVFALNGAQPDEEAPAPAATNQPATDLVTFSGDGYAVDIPPNWSDVTDADMLSTVEDALAPYMASLEGSTVDYTLVDLNTLVGVFILKQRMPSALPLSTIEALQRQRGEEFGVEVREMGQVSLPNIDAVRALVGIEPEEIDFERLLFYYFADGPMLYWFIFVAPTPDFAANLALFDQVAGTFRLVE